MDLGGSGSGSIVKKQEDDDKGEKRDVKPIVKTLNRVPRMSSSYRPKKPALKIKFITHRSLRKSRMESDL